MFKYAYFRGMSPLCAIRLRDYPDLQKPISQMDHGELEDAQHQWAYGNTGAVMQRCFEVDCQAVRPVPMHGYTAEDQNFILQTFFRWMTGELGEPLPGGQVMRHT